MDAGIDLAAGEPADCRFVEVTVFRERRDERGADSSEWRSHKCSLAGFKACATALSLQA
jgi:hypothetical protein